MIWIIIVVGILLLAGIVILLAVSGAGTLPSAEERSQNESQVEGLYPRDQRRLYSKHGETYYIDENGEEYPPGHWKTLSQ